MQRLRSPVQARCFRVIWDAHVEMGRTRKRPERGGRGGNEVSQPALGELG